MLPLNIQEKIELICYKIISNMFATFNNPKSRGPNFKWENFPEMMQEMCELHVSNTKVPKKHEVLVREYVKTTSLYIAKSLVKKMEE